MAKPSVTIDHIHKLAEELGVEVKNNKCWFRIEGENNKQMYKMQMYRHLNHRLKKKRLSK